MLLLEGSAVTRLTFAGQNGPLANTLAAVRTLLDAYLPMGKRPAAKKAKTAKVASA